MWSSSNYLLPNCILTCFNIINDPTLRCSSKFSSLHADKHAYCASLPYILPGLRLHVLVAYNKYKDFKLSNNNGNFRTHLGKRCPLGLWHRDPTGCLKLKSMTNLRLRVEDNIGWLGQRQVCQCFYFWHIVTYLNHPIPITSSTLTTSQCLAKQTLSLLWLCLLVLFYTFDQADAECIHARGYSLYIFTGSFALTVRSTCDLLCNAPCSSGKIVAPTWRPCTNQLWVEPRSTWRSNLWV